MTTLDLFSSGPPSAGDTAALAEYAERAYLEYALSVVKGRALPDVSDGQKPVQRRILYAMARMGLAFTTAAGPKAVKSARVVGDVLGRFHPHSDQAAYDALVRMAQDFSQRYPLVDGQGNFGSRDGDGAAAMRYTEARLAPIARLLLDEIDEGTVDFIANYDGSTEEPRLLPARLPFVLLNGASGIAVGLATEIPSHNLREVAAAAIALIKDDKLGDDDLYKLVPGPDYPGGGQIISTPEEIRAAYAGGRGSLKVRARWKIEDLARGQWQVVVTELPPGTSAQKVLEEIEELTNPKVRAGKKALGSEQLQLKATVLAVLDAVRDESSKDAPVRLVFEPKTSRIAQDELLNDAARAHQPGKLDADQPDHGRRRRPADAEEPAPAAARVDRLSRRHGRAALAASARQGGGADPHPRRAAAGAAQHRRGDRPDPLGRGAEGGADRALRPDRAAGRGHSRDSPAPAGPARGDPDRAGARRAAHRGSKLRDLLASPAALRRTVVREIEADTKAFGDDRRTLIEAGKRSVAEIRVVDEPVTVVVSLKGWVRALKGHEVDPAQLGFKAGDGLYGTFGCRSVDTLLVFGSDGRVYSIAVASLPSGRGDGQAVTSLIDLEPGTQSAHYFAGPATQMLLLAGTGGFGLMAQAGDLVSRQRGGKSFLALEGDEKPLPPSMVTEATVRVACLTLSGRLLVFGVDELKVQAKGGRGLTLVDLDPKDALVSVAAFAEALRIQGTGRGDKPRDEVLRATALEPYLGRRARKGRRQDAIPKARRVVAAGNS